MGVVARAGFGSANALKIVKLMSAPPMKWAYFMKDVLSRPHVLTPKLAIRDDPNRTSVLGFIE